MAAHSPWEKRITLAITGASGAPYALRLLELLVKADYQVYVLISSAAKVVFATEEQLQLPSGKDAQSSVFYGTFCSSS